MDIDPIMQTTLPAVINGNQPKIKLLITQHITAIHFRKPAYIMGVIFIVTILCNCMLHSVTKFCCLD